MTMACSAAARQEDKKCSDLVGKRKAVEEEKKKMLAKLTGQIQLCLEKLQNSSLDEAGKEKYQDLIQSLKVQMAKISGIK